MRIIIVVMNLLFITTIAFAGDIPAPPPLPGETVVEQDYFQKIYENMNVLEVTTTAPNGVTKGRKGQMVLYHTAAVELWVNLDSNLWWQRIN